MKKKERKIPFPFVLELLDPAKPFTRPMFGCEGVYVGEKIVLMLRDKEKFPRDNGVWVASTEEHKGSLKKEFPSLRPIEMFEGMATAWQNLPLEAEDFETSATEICELVLARDPRIGKIPKSRASKKKKVAAKRPTKRKVTRRINSSD